MRFCSFKIVANFCFVEKRVLKRITFEFEYFTELNILISLKGIGDREFFLRLSHTNQRNLYVFLVNRTH